MKGLILTYLITASAAVGALRYPVYGLYVYVAFAILRPQAIWGFAGDLSNLSLIVGTATLIGWAMAGFGSWRFGRGKPVVVALILFCIWFALASLFALAPLVSFESCVALSKFVLPFLVGATMMEGEKQWLPMLWTIVVSQGYVGLEQNLNYVLKGYNSAVEGFGGMDNNCFGISLVTVLGPAVALMILSKTWKARAIAALSAALILHTTLLTYSRGALVGLIALALTAFIMMPKRPKYLAAILITVVLAVRFTGPQLAARYATTFAPDGQRDYSEESRLELWSDCLLVIESHPVLGVGPGNWRIVASSYGWSQGKSAHSVWMETAADVGLPGLLALVAFFGIPVLRLWPIARSKLTDANRYDIALAIGVVLSIVGFAVAGQFVSVPGMEAPYYITMVGVAALKTSSRAAISAAPAQLGKSRSVAFQVSAPQP